MSLATRRSVLRLSGLGVAGGLAGCASLADRGSGSARLEDLLVVNHNRRPRDVHVLLVRGDAPEYWTERTVPAAEDGDPGTAVLDGYPTAPGDYVLHARTERGPASGRVSFDLGETDAACLRLNVTIGDPNRSGPGEVSVWRATDSDGCGAEPTPNADSSIPE